MKKFLLGITLAAFSLLSITTQNVNAQQGVGCWANWGNPQFTPGCSNATLNVPSTGWTYWSGLPSTTYTFSATGGGGWTTPYISIYYLNSSCSWVGLTGGNSSVTFTTPGAGSVCGGGVGFQYLVVVNNGNACAPSWPGTSATLTYRANAVTTSGSIALSATQICQGSSVNVNNTATPSITLGSQLFQWYRETTPGSGNWTLLFDNSTSVSISDVPPGPGTYRYLRRSYSSSCGACANSTCVDAITATLTVDATSNAGTYAHAGLFTCDGQTRNASGTVVTNSVSGQVGTVQWQWGSSNGTWNNWGSGATAPGNTCFPANPTSTEADRMRVIVTNGTCPAATGNTVLVQTPANPTITSVSAAASPICGQATTTLTANGVSGFNNTVTWWTGSGGTGNNLGTGTTKVVGASVGTTYYARVTDVCGNVVNCGGKVTGVAEASTTVGLDATNPTLTVPSNISLNTSPNNTCRGAGIFANPSLSDACSNGASAQIDVVSGISGLQLWTRADAGVVLDANNRVAQWTDLSGNGRHFRQSTFSARPTLTTSNSSFNNNPSLTFNTTQFMTNLTNIGSGGAGTYTMFTVSRLNGGTNSRLISSASTNWLLGYWGNNMNQHYANGWVNNPTLAPNTVAHMYSVTSAGAGANTTFYDYGNILASNNNAGNPNLPGQLQLNGWNNGLNEMSTGEIAEVIYYDRVLTAAERQLVEGYLAFKYNLSVPIASHQAFQTYANGNTRTFQAADAAGNKVTNSTPSVAVTAYPAPSVTDPASPACNTMTFTTSGMAPAGKKLTATGNNWLCVGGGTCSNPGTSNLAVGSNWTIEAWYNAAALPANTGSWNTLVRGTGNHHIIIDRGGNGGSTTGQLGVYNGGFVSSGFNIIANITSGWHHIAAVGSGGRTTFYIDGVRVGIANSQPTDNIVAIGNFQGGGQSFGEIDEVRIWNVALPQNTISNYMTQNVTSGHPNWNSMVAYYKMDGSGTNSATGTAACGSCTGSLQGANWTNDVAFYTYNWSISSGTASPSLSTTAEAITVTNASQGTFNYSVTATANSCNSQTRTGSVTVPTVGVPNVDGITTTVNVNKCGGATIPLTPGTNANTCRVYNGIPPSGGGSGSLIASGSSYAFTSSQTVYITSYNSTTGCESTGGLGVGYVQVNITVSPSFTFSVATTQPSCNGGSNGTATATLGTPGTSPYTFNWSGGNAGGASFGVARTGFTAGNYQVTVNDNAGCQAVQTFTISEPSALQIANATLSNYNGFNVSCNGSSNGSISLTVSGGTGGYTYTWSPNVSTSANANSLVAGTYNVTVRDANLCSVTASYTLSQPNLLAPSVAIGYGCGGATYTNSTIVVTPAGGVPNYTYQFSGGTISGNQTTVTSNGLYGYTVTDANNCSVSGSANVTQIGQPVSANDACNAIYVSSSGVSSASGTKSCPTTLVNALTLLSASRNKILIEGTTFNISQKLVIPVIGGNPAITIEGGYNVSGTTWIKTSNQKTILNITSAEENPANNIAHRIGISAVGVSNFTLQDLTVNVTGYSGNSYVNGTNTSASQGFGKSVYGIYVNNCSNYNIVRCAVTVGNATAGSPGSPGSAGANGGNGGNGQTAVDGCAGVYYAPGGSSSCSSGGTGGGNSNCSFYPAGGSPGAGGACGGGAGSDNCNNTACSNPGAGGRGCDGVDGADQGQAAAGGSGSISSGFWLPGSQGATGANGGNGTGGGGGGGGGASYGGICNSRTGGSGGGGGGAGCGGTGGTGGFGGGSAYAIFTNGNSGTNNVIDCSLSTGSAGSGGTGGTGGSGGSRGFGGIGGASVNCETARGGDGGNGGRGGNGGQGGNGQAGEAVTLKIVSGSVTQNGTSVPNASDPVTVDADQGCTNSIITVTKSLSAGNFNIPSGASIVNDLNSSTPSTTVAGPTMYVTFASGQTGKKDLVAGSTTYRNYYDIRYDRTPPTMSVSDLNPCRNAPITLTCTNDGSNPSGNPVTYEWQIISGVTPSNPSSGIVNAQSTTHTFTAVGTYQVRLRVKVSCCGWSAPIYQTINVQDVPANATSITQGIPVACQNQNGVTYTVGAVSGATSYNWTVTGGTIASGQGSSQITVNWGGGTSGTVSVRPANSCGNSPSAYTINVTLNGNPTASINPTPVTADFCAGGSVTLQGGATSGGGAGNGTFSYAWSTSQLIQTISVNSANTYFLTVTEGGSGCKGITSINVTQLSPPSITTHPANSGVCEQTNTSFTVAATGAGLTYQWQVSTDGGGTWNNITAAGSNPTYAGFNSSATLNLNGVVNANNGWRYRVIVSGTCSPSVTSNAAILTVNPAPTISQSPQASTICNGDNTSFTVTASGFGSLSYQWQVNDGGGWANITAPGSNPTYGGYNSSNTLTLTGAPTAVNGYNYRVVVSGGCAPSATSSPALLTVNPTSVGGTAGTTGNGPTICTGGTTTLLLGGNTGSVQWQDSPDGTNWTNIPGATSTLYNTPVLTADRYYRAIVTSGVCPSATSTVQLISVKNSIAGTASSDQTICTGSQPANISLTGFNGAIQWQQADDAAFTTGLINIPGGTNSTLTGALIGVLTSTKYFRAQVTDFPCGTVSSNTVTVTVSPLTVAGNVTGGSSPICEGGNTGVMTLSGNTGAVVKWQKRVNSGAWSDIANTALTYSEVPSSSGTWDYRAVVQSGACAAANSSFTTIVVNSAPAITILPQGNDTLGCNNDIFVLNTSISGGGGGAISYQWAEFDYGNSSYTNIGGATNASYTTVPLVNLDNTNDAFYKYRVTYNRAGSGCPSASDEVEIKIFPSPSLTSTMDECASTVFSNGNDMWDYIYTIGSAATPTWVVADTTGGAELVYQAPNNNGEGFKIYRIPIGSGSQTFKITDDNGCVVYSTLGRNSTLPNQLPNTVMPGNAIGQCYLTGFNEWVHFKKQGSNSEVIASIKDNGVDLGVVTVESYRESTSPQIPNSGPTCAGTPVAAMRRHYRVTSNKYSDPNDKFLDGNGSPTNIELQLYFSQSDFNDLVSSAAGNNINGNQCTEDDDITQLNSLYLTKYSDYDQLGNEDGDYMNNSTNSAYYRVFNVGNVSNPLVIQQNGFDNIFGTNGSGYHYAALSITEFSEFWLHGSNNGSPLPVEMLFIEAKNINNSYIQINWATATELNNWKFDVERSTDGVNFSKIGEVIGNGTSTDRHDYSYNDKNVVAGIRYYYRLKQVDFDESYEYSPVVSEMLRGDDLFKVSDFVPNPAADQAKLIITTGKEQEVQIEMHNYLGEIVKKGTTYLNKGSNTINFDFGDLAAGTYTTRVVAGTNTHVRRVVITR